MTWWQPIDTVPSDGTTVDLWIKGSREDLEFFAPACTKIRGAPGWHGRACNMQWREKVRGRAGWFQLNGFTFRVFDAIIPTHWMPVPEEPE